MQIRAAAGRWFAITAYESSALTRNRVPCLRGGSPRLNLPRANRRNLSGSQVVAGSVTTNRSGTLTSAAPDGQRGHRIFLLVRGVETDSHAQRYHGSVVGRSVEPLESRCKVLAHRAAVAAGRILNHPVVVSRWFGSQRRKRSDAIRRGADKPVRQQPRPALLSKFAAADGGVGRLSRDVAGNGRGRLRFVTLTGLRISTFNASPNNSPADHGDSVGGPMTENDAPSPITLRWIFETHMQGDRREKSTSQNILTSVANFEAFLRVQRSTTSTCATRLTDQDLVAWQQWMSDDRQFAASTVNKQWKHIREILRRAGPRDTGNPRGLGLLDRVPYVAMLKERGGIVHTLTLEQVDQLYVSAELQRWPDHPAGPTDVWRAIIVLGYTFGLHFADLANLTSDSISVDHPDPDSQTANDRGWLKYSRQKTGRDLILPMSRAVSVRLAAIAGGSSGGLLGFDRRNSRVFYSHWDHLRRRCELPGVEFRCLRKTCNSAWNRLKPGMGKWVLGHVPRGVNETFYCNVEPDLAALVHDLPASPSWARPSGPQQKWLFDE